MSTSTGDMSWLASGASRRAIASLLLLLASACPAEESAAWRQDFENRIPGQTPEGWTRAWGCGLLEDVFTTSNMEALSGSRSLLLERQSYEKPGQYGLARLTPPINAAAARLEIPFLVRGPTAYGASFSIEMRSKSGLRRLAALGLRNGAAIIQTGDFKKSAPLGKVEFGAWHRFVVFLPLEADKGKSCKAALERQQMEGSWIPCGGSAEVGLVFSIEPDRQLSIQIIPGSTGVFQLFADDLVAVGFDCR